jgi:hypothetical protein
MTMVGFLGNFNLWYTGYGNDSSRYCWWPGTCHESRMYECKLGIGAALNDAKNNHPNDYYSVIMFSAPLQTTGNVTDNMPSYKIINGDSSTVVSGLQTAIAKILQDGVQVSLIQ